MSHLEEGQLHELLDGELDESARAAALAHLAGCERCRAAYEEARSFLAESDALIEAVQVPAAPVALAAAAAPAPAAPVVELRDIGSASRLRRYRTLAWAASVMVAVGLGWYGSSLSRQAHPAAATENVLASTDSGPRAAQEQMADAVAKQARSPKPEPPRDERLARQRAAVPAAAAAPAPAPEPTAPLEGALAEKARVEEDKSPAVAGAGADQVLATADRTAPQAQAANQAPAAAAPLKALGAEWRRKESESSSGIRIRGAARPAVQPPVLSPISMEEAVRILGGSIRLIDGLTPTRILSGREPERVRVVYEDPPGRELWLDQTRSMVRGYVGAAEGAATTVLPGDTTDVAGAGGSRSLLWMDQSGFQLVLTGFLPADSLRQLVRRIQ